MEGFGLVVVEAAAAGLPIITSRIPGIPDSAQSSPYAILLDPQDTEGFVHAVLDGLNQPKTDFAPVPALLQPFDISTSSQNLLEIYTSGD
jgi:glycosyltransferase involved in cell wall biosynthesis